MKMDNAGSWRALVSSQSYCLLIMIEADDVTIMPNEKSPLKEPDQCLELFGGKKGRMKKKLRIVEWKKKKEIRSRKSRKCIERKERGSCSKSKGSLKLNH